MYQQQNKCNSPSRYCILFSSLEHTRTILQIRTAISNVKPSHGFGFCLMLGFRFFRRWQCEFSLNAAFVCWRFLRWTLVLVILWLLVYYFCPWDVRQTPLKAAILFQGGLTTDNVKHDEKYFGFLHCPRIYRVDHNKPRWRKTTSLFDWYLNWLKNQLIKPIFFIRPSNFFIYLF